MPSQEKRGTPPRPTGYWYGEVDFRNKGGQRFRRRFETRKLALGYEAYVKATGEEPEGTGATPQGRTFKQAVIEMRAGNFLPGDISGRNRLDWLVGVIGDRPISSLTTGDFDRIVADLEKRPARMRDKARISDSTINRYLSGASGVLSWAADRVAKGDAPIHHIKLPWRAEKGLRIHWYTEEQEAAICSYLVSMDQRSEALIMRVLCATGMRWSELAGLRPDQVQPEWVLLDDTKNGTSRDVPIEPALASELRALVRSGGVPKYETMRLHLKRAVEVCGYSAKLGIHNCRHTTATRLIMKGEPLPNVKEFLGHNDIATTMKYVHVQKSALKEASKKLYPHRGETAQNDGMGEVLPLRKSAG